MNTTTPQHKLLALADRLALIPGLTDSADDSVDAVEREMRALAATLPPDHSVDTNKMVAADNGHGLLITDEMVERAAFAVEKATIGARYGWTDEQFDTWWNRDPTFVSHSTSWGFFQGTHKEKRLFETRIALDAAFALATHPSQQEQPELARYQPCGCVTCVCEDEEQCQGCGSKHCGKLKDHPPYVLAAPAAPATPDRKPLSDETLRAIADSCTGQGGESGQYVAGWKDAVAYIAANVKTPQVVATPESAEPEPVAWPQVRGCGRDGTDGTGRTLYIFLAERPSDGALRAIHDALLHPTPAASDGGLREALNEAERKALEGLMHNALHEATRANVDVDDHAPLIDDDEDAYWAFHNYNGLRKSLATPQASTPFSAAEPQQDADSSPATLTSDGSTPAAVAPEQVTVPDGFLVEGPFPDSSNMTDEYNAKHRWGAKRIKAPFCGEDGVRAWYGPTIEEACAAGVAALAAQQKGGGQ